MWSGGRAFAESFLERKTGESAFALREQLGNLMWANVGIVRTGEKLKSAIVSLSEMRTQTGNIAVAGSRAFNLGWQQALDVSNLLTAADLIARSALHREDSRGAHFREDFPAHDDLHWKAHLVEVRAPD